MTDSAGPVVIVSDIHLWWSHSWRGFLDRMRPLWAGARTVVFNGDTMNPSISRDDAKRSDVLAYIRGLCAADGVDATFLAGTTDYQLGMPRHLILGGSQVLVMHGDAVFPSISPWRLRSRAMGAAREAARQRLTAAERNTLAGELACVQEAVSSEAGRPRARRRRGGKFGRLLVWLRMAASPPTPVLILWAWARMPFLAARFADQYAPEADFVVIGHAHKSGIWRLRGKTVINTGSFEGPGMPRLVRITAAELAVCAVRKSGGEFRPGKTIGRYPLRLP